MTTGAKSFNQKHYDLNDPSARKEAKIILFAQGYVALDNPDQYGIDLIVNDGNGRLCALLEVEVKHGWTVNTFPFKTLHIPKRKLKFCEYTFLQTFFCVFSENMQNHVVVPAAEVQKASIITKDNIYVKGEEFVSIERHKGIYNGLYGFARVLEITV